MISVGSISLGNSLLFSSMIIKPTEDFPNKRETHFCRDFAPGVSFQAHVGNIPNEVPMQRWYVPCIKDCPLQQDSLKTDLASEDEH